MANEITFELCGRKYTLRYKESGGLKRQIWDNSIKGLPYISIENISQGDEEDTWHQATVEINYSAADASRGETARYWTYCLNNGEDVTAYGDTFTISDLPEGSHDLKVKLFADNLEIARASESFSAAPPASEEPPGPIVHNSEYWNADYTVWSRGFKLGYAEPQPPTLTHIGGGVWELVTHSLGHTETEWEDGSEETAYVNVQYSVIWDALELPQGIWYTSRNAGSHFGQLTLSHTYSVNGPMDMYIGIDSPYYAGPEQRFSNLTFVQNYTEDLYSNGGGLWKITIPEVNPDNPA